MRRAPLVVLVVAAALLALPAVARPYAVKVDEGSAKGPRVVLAPRAGHDAVLVVSFAVGSVDDGIQSGLTRLTQHMLLDGNGREPGGELRRDLYAAAAELDITTEVRRSTFRLRAPRERFEVLAQRLLEAVFAPKLDKRQLSRCRRMTLNDEMPGGSREDALAFLAGSVLMAEGGEGAGADFHNEPYGDAEVVRRLTFDDVERHVATKLTPANATVIVTGAFDTKRIARTLQRYEGGVRRPPQRPDVTRYLPLSFERRAPRARFVQAHVLSLDAPEQAAAARLLAAILDERLRAKLRGQGLGYDGSAFVTRREWLDLLVVEVPVSAGPVVDVSAELRALAADVRAGSFAAGEFERNKRFALEALARDDADAARLADALDAAGRVPWHDDDVRAAVEEMAQAVFLSHVRPWLDEKATIHVTLLPAGDAEAAP